MSVLQHFGCIQLPACKERHACTLQIGRDLLLSSSVSLGAFTELPGLRRQVLMPCARIRFSKSHEILPSIDRWCDVQSNASYWEEGLGGGLLEGEMHKGGLMQPHPSLQMGVSDVDHFPDEHSGYQVLLRRPSC